MAPMSFLPIVLTLCCLAVSECNAQRFPQADLSTEITWKVPKIHGGPYAAMSAALSESVSVEDWCKICGSCCHGHEGKSREKVLTTFTV